MVNCHNGRTLKRFIHYRDRWEGHSASEKLESEQVETIKQKIVSLEETMSMAKDFAWLMQARLPRCLTHCCFPLAMADLFADMAGSR